jgi:hypothetical protein
MAEETDPIAAASSPAPPSTNWAFSTAVFRQEVPAKDTKYYPDPTDPRPLSIFADTHPAE